MNRVRGMKATKFFRKLTIEPKQFIVFIVILISGFCLADITIRFRNVFYLSPKQKLAIQNLDKNFRDGFIKIEDIYPIEGWDTVCVLPAFSYMRPIFLIPRSFSWEDQQFSKTNIFKLWLMPDSSSMYYGLGFAFLKNEYLVDFVHIPSAQVSFFRGGNFFVNRPIEVNVPQHEANGTRSVMHFSDLNVAFQNNKTCFPRQSAFMRYRGYQDIYVGEQ